MNAIIKKGDSIRIKGYASIFEVYSVRKDGKFYFTDGKNEYTGYTDEENYVLVTKHGELKDNPCCRININKNFNFCPKCGRKLKALN